EEQRVGIEHQLAADAPDIRFLMVQDESWITTVRRYTLRFHRDDREKARLLIDKALTALDPSKPVGRVGRTEARLAATVRQYVRAKDAEDRVASQEAGSDLCRSLQWMVEVLIHYARLNQAVDLWLDGIGGTLTTIEARYRVAMLGHIWSGR